MNILVEIGKILIKAGPQRLGTGKMAEPVLRKVPVLIEVAAKAAKIALKTVRK